MTIPEDAPTTVTENEAEQIAEANASGATPVVFVHGLWLLASSWDRWAGVRGGGLRAAPTGLAGRPRDLDEAQANPEVFADKTIGQVADHFDAVISGLDSKPAVVGHSFGGLLAQILAGRGLAQGDGRRRPGAVPRRAPAAFLGAQGLQLVLRNPANRQPGGAPLLRAIPLRVRKCGLRG